MIVSRVLPYFYDRVAGIDAVVSEIYALLPNIYDGIGLIGVCLYVIAYMGVQIGQIDGNRITYTCLNGAAATCIMFSLMGAFNLASALVNGLFMIFSMIGAARILLRSRHSGRSMGSMRSF